MPDELHAQYFGNWLQLQKMLGLKVNEYQGALTLFCFNY
tara:strand:- start:453 stop:569 length:117 start_codon:yes stop_codon:yes gene_type:complete